MDDWLLTRADLLPTFSSDGASPKYVVALQDARAVGGEGALPMKDKYGRPYSCSIPDTTQHDEEAQGASPKVYYVVCTPADTCWHVYCKHTVQAFGAVLLARMLSSPLKLTSICTVCWSSANAAETILTFYMLSARMTSRLHRRV